MLALRTSLDGATRTDDPPAPDDAAAIWTRLAALPRAEREGLLLFGAMVFLSGDRGPQGASILSGICENLGFTQADVDAVIPTGQIILRDLRITPPSSDWAIRVSFGLMCSFATTSETDHREQINVLGHFGEQLGLCDRALARIISAELGVHLRARR